MGKGKRSKDRKAEELLQNPDVKTSSKERTGTWTKIALIAIAVVLVVTLSLVFIQSSGILVRLPVVYETDNFKVNGAMMQYMFNTQYQQFLGTYSSYLNYMGINTAVSLRNQAFDTSQGLLSYFVDEEYKDFKGTWFDYFWALAEAQAKETLALCEKAKASGLVLKPEDEKEIEDSINSLYKEMETINEEYRAEYEAHYGVSNYVQFSSMKQYLAATFGNGVNISDIRNTLKLSVLAANYYNQEIEKIRNGIESDDEQVTAFYEKNKNDYYKADYIYISFDASYSKPTDTNQVDAKWTAYLNEIGKALDKIKEINEFETADEIKTYMIKMWFEESYQTQYDKTINELKKKDNEDKTGKVLTDADIPSKEIQNEKKEKILAVIIDAILTDKEEADLEPSGDTAFDGAIDAIRNSLLSSIRSKVNSMVKEKAAYDDSTDELKWVFSNLRTEGEHIYFPSLDVKYKEAEAVAMTSSETPAETPAETPDETPAETPDSGNGGTEPDDSKDDQDTYVNNWDIKADINKEDDHKFNVGFYYVIKPQYRQEELVRKFGHILFKPADASTDEAKEKALEEAKKEAEKILEEIKSGELTDERFEEIAKKNTADGNVYYDNVKPDDMVEEVNDWLFAEDRKAGDLEIVESEYGYHIMYFVEISDKPTYFIYAREDLISESSEKWFEDTKAAVSIKEKEGFAKKTISVAGH